MTSLREEIDALPLVTRKAMLRAVQSGHPLMTGTWSENRTPCPLLAAHRLGGRCHKSITSKFPAALDEWAGVNRRTLPRQLTEREREELDNLLTQSLAQEWKLRLVEGYQATAQEDHALAEADMGAGFETLIPA